MNEATFVSLDAWIDAHFEEEVRFLQALVQVPTDTPPGDNAPHALRTAALLRDMGLEAEQHAVPQALVHAERGEGNILQGLAEIAKGRARAGGENHVRKRHGMTRWNPG